MASRAALFLDRDGTLHVERADPLRAPEHLELFPHVARALERAVFAGWELVIVTNQSAIARGRLDFDQLRTVQRALSERLESPALRRIAVYVCPHHPSEGRPPYVRACDCRKPSTGLFTRAARDLGLDLQRSWVIGDARRDVEAGLACGTRAVLVRTGKGEKQRHELGALAPRVTLAADVVEAIDWILRVGADQGK